MLIEYYATDEEDKALERAIEHLHIDNAFNPEEGYYVIDTRDERVLTVMSLLNVEMYVTDTDKNWHQYAYGADDLDKLEDSN